MVKAMGTKLEQFKIVMEKSVAKKIKGIAI